MADFETLIRQTSNRGKTHVFLGHPLSDICDKTTVEPGNTFSPGVWTCGISVWIEANDHWYTPDLLADEEIAWEFSGATGCPPIIESRFPAGDTVQVTHRLGYLGGEGAEGADFAEVQVSTSVATNITLAIVVKDVGPAGGLIESLSWDESRQALLINGCSTLTVEQRPTAYQILPANAQYDSPVGILMFQLPLQVNEPQRIAFSVQHSFANRPFAMQLGEVRPYEGLAVKAAMKQSALEWKEALPARIIAPDERLVRAWETSAYHMLANMECGLPRIGAINYPVFWMRDCVAIIRALDLIGRHDLARLGNDYLAPHDFSGGFGAEADAPGEGIWSLVRHAEITGDTNWLNEVFPTIRRRIDWIERMRTTKLPLRAITENRVPGYLFSPGCNVVCLPAKHGLIHGRMDWHSPDFYINCWAVSGYSSAASAASLLGDDDLAAEWMDKALALEERIAKYLLPDYGNERDTIVTPYPCMALAQFGDLVMEKFRDWYAQNRLTPDRQRIPEPLWTYFEAAQIHNAILLGMKRAAWINLDGMLNDGDPWNVFAYTEGRAHGEECMPYHHHSIECRGWLHAKEASGGNMPHIWTAAEMLALIRDMFVMEGHTGLILGRGIPEYWLRPGARFGVRDMPTNLGPVSYLVVVQEDGELAIEYSGPENFQFDFMTSYNVQSEVVVVDAE